MELAAEPLHPAVTLAYPFPAQLAGEMRGLFETVGADAPAYVFERLQNRDGPAALPEAIRRGEPREAGADDDAASSLPGHVPPFAPAGLAATAYFYSGVIPAIFTTSPHFF